MADLKDHIARRIFGLIARLRKEAEEAYKTSILWRYIRYFRLPWANKKTFHMRNRQVR